MLINMTVLMLESKNVDVDLIHTTIFYLNCLLAIVIILLLNFYVDIIFVIYILLFQTGILINYSKNNKTNLKSSIILTTFTMICLIISSMHYVRAKDEKSKELEALYKNYKDERESQPY
jgi:hypothetical protein